MGDPGAAGGAGSSSAGVGGAASGGFVEAGAGPGNCTPGMPCFEGPNFECPPKSDFCRRCDLDEDCGGGLPRCAAFLEHCVECLIDADCDDPNEARCDPLTLHCVPGCSAQDLACPQERRVCDTSRNACVACVWDNHCLGFGDDPYCAAGECVECTNHGHCASRGLMCWNFECRECRRDDDCGDNRRCSDSGRCEGP